MCVQNIVPDLSYTVRSPMLDTWEGIKQLKAALWALVSIFTLIIEMNHRNEITLTDLNDLFLFLSPLQGNIGSSNWGLNLLQEENVIPDILTLAQHCEVLSVRG